MLPGAADASDPGSAAGRESVAMVRLVRLLAALLLAITAAGVAVAQPAAGWRPDRPIRILVGYPPAVGPDLIARALAAELQKQLGGAPVIVENRPGAGGTLGAEAVARAAPDGLTLGAIPAAPIAVNPHLSSRIPYDPLRDFTPVGPVAAFGSFVLVHPSAPVRSLAELGPWLRANGASTNCNGATVGSLLHIAMAMLVQALGADCPLVHSAAAGSLADMIAGRLQVGVDNIAVAAGPVRAGQLRALAVTSAQRLPDWPDLPAVAEVVPGFEAVSWMGLFGPTGLPPAVVARLAAALADARDDPGLLARFAQLSAIPLPGGPEALSTRLAAEHAKWGRVIREAGIRVD
jgi:tripartite-type tricarboxylate transporter receptor subunit TctC